MRSALALFVLADLTVASLAGGCGASLGDDGNAQSDASTNDGKLFRDAGVDARPDARPCMGGTTAMTAPDGSCFVFVSTPSTYVQARAGCTAMMGHLAKLDTAALDTAAEALVGTNDTF